MLKRVERRFSVETSFSDGTEKLRRGNFLCFTKCLVSKCFCDKRRRRKEREYRDILSKLFV